MSSYRSFAPAPSSNLESLIQSWESSDPPKTYEGLTPSSTASTHAHGGPRRVHDRAVGLRVSLTGWNLTDPCEFISSRVPRPKCAPTAELFGHLQSYSQYAHPSPREEGDDGDDDHEEDTSAPDVLSLLKKRQREKLRESAGVKPKPTRKHTVGPSTSKPRTALPPPGRMRCRWGDDCTVQMDFDYTFDTIKDWKAHIVSHLARPSETTEDSTGKDQKVKMVKCSWGGCSAEVERGYLFKHIITHEVRFKLLCPRGCEVAIRGDNLERHLRTCPLAD